MQPFVIRVFYYLKHISSIIWRGPKCMILLSCFGQALGFCSFFSLYKANLLCSNPAALRKSVFTTITLGISDP